MFFFVEIIFVGITIIGLIGNFLVLFVITVNRQLHDSINFLICNLALADLLFLTLCVPITAYSYVYSWNFSETICYITVTLQYVTCYVSVWTLVLLAYDRYISITNAVASRSLRRDNGVTYVCVGVWLSIFALNFPQMRDVGVLSFQYNGTIKMACVDSMSIATETSSVLQARIFYWGFNIGAYVLPLALSILFYFLLVRAIWKQKIVQSKSSEKMKRHATKMVFIVIITFGVCWLPQNMRFFLRGLNYPKMTFWERNAELLLLVQSTIQTIAYANSCINPILYGALSERFRLGLISAWRRFCCCNKGKYERYQCKPSIINLTKGCNMLLLQEKNKCKFKDERHISLDALLNVKKSMNVTKFSTCNSNIYNHKNISFDNSNDSCNCNQPCANNQNNNTFLSNRQNDNWKTMSKNVPHKKITKCKSLSKYSLNIKKRSNSLSSIIANPQIVGKTVNISKAKLRSTPSDSLVSNVLFNDNTQIAYKTEIVQRNEIKNDEKSITKPLLGKKNNELRLVKNKISKHLNTFSQFKSRSTPNLPQKKIGLISQFSLPFLYLHSLPTKSAKPMTQFYISYLTFDSNDVILL